MKKTIDLLKKYNFIIIISALTLLGLFILFKQAHYAFIDKTKKAQIIFIVSSITTILVTIFNILFIKKSKKTPIYKKFFIVALLYGLIYLISIPAFLGTDEVAHYLRSYQISAGDIIVKDPINKETLIPKQLWNFLASNSNSIRYTKEYAFNPTNYNELVPIWHGNNTAVSYSPIPYIPQVIGFWISKFLNLSPLLTIFCVRFVNMIVWLSIIAYAIKRFPVRKLSLAIYLLSPAILSLVSTCSYDAFSMSLIVLFISIIMSYKEKKEKLSRKDLIILLLTSALFCSYKVIYIFLIFLLFLIPNKSFKTKKFKFTYILLILLISIFIDFGWYFISQIPTEEITSTGGILLILKKPFNYLFIYCNTFINSVSHYFINLFAGNEMCYSLARINEIFIWIYIIIFLFSLSYDKKIKSTKKENVLIILLILFICALISVGLWVGWSIPNQGMESTKIIGIQSRYYIVFMPIIIAIMPKVFSKLKIDERYLFIVSMIINMFMIIDTIKSLL